jgi:hypothetical protein
MEQRGKKVERKCQNKRCGAAFIARIADVQRGWGKFCSKSCKASHQEANTGQYANLLYRTYEATKWGDGDVFDDAHLFSNEEHDCNKGI